MLDLTVRTKLEELRRKLRKKERVLVAFSGGVDSGLVLNVAAEVLDKEHVVAVTIDSELLPRRELEQVKRFIAQTGIAHKIVSFAWQSTDDFVKNPHDRCYYCKREIAKILKGVAAKAGVTTIAEGVTVSDLGEYRPGLVAAEEAGLWHPLVEVGITKREVRQLAKELMLPFWNKPPSPCLATRIAYGERLTMDKLAMIEAAEDFLQESGFNEFRVRLHRGGLARIEIAKEELGVFCDTALLQRVSQKLKALGYTYVTLDLEGYRRGSMDTRH